MSGRVGGYVHRWVGRRIDGWMDGALPQKNHAIRASPYVHDFPSRSMARPSTGVGQDHARTGGLNGRDQEKAAVKRGL